jgi:hypothetical protein
MQKIIFSRRSSINFPNNILNVCLLYIENHKPVRVQRAVQYNIVNNSKKLKLQTIDFDTACHIQQPGSGAAKKGPLKKAPLAGLPGATAISLFGESKANSLRRLPVRTPHIHFRFQRSVTKVDRASHFFSSKRAKEEAKLEAIHKTDPHSQPRLLFSLGALFLSLCESERVCDECGVEMRAQGLCYYNALWLYTAATAGHSLAASLIIYYCQTQLQLTTCKKRARPL